jgi:O-antigen ligase
VWAFSIMEIIVLLMLITIVVRKCLLQGEKFSFPFIVPISAFLFLIFFQMVPLPPSTIRFLSPKTYELYSQTLDEYPREMREDRGERLIIEGTQPIGQRLEVGGKTLKSRNTKGFFENWRTISVDPYSTRTELLKIISYLGVFLLIINYVDSKQKLMLVSTVIIFSGIVVVFLGIAQKVTEAPRIYWFWKPLFKNDASFFGPFVNPNHFAGYVEMIIPLSIGLFMTKWRCLTKNQRGIREFFITIGNEEGCKLILFLFFTILMVGALFLSSSRGGIISFLGSMVFLLAMMIKKEKGSRNVTLLIVFLISIVSFLLWMGISPLIEEFSSIQDLSRDYDIQYRFQNWKDMLGLMKDFPLLGVGLETFHAIFPKYKTIGLQYHYLYLENDYLQLLCEMGLLGFGIFLWFMLSLFRQIGSGYSRHGTRKRSGVHYISFYGCLTGMVAIVIHSFWDFNMHIPSNAQLLSMLMGLAIAGVHIRPQGHSDYPQGNNSRLAIS